MHIRKHQISCDMIKIQNLLLYVRNINIYNTYSKQFEMCFVVT